MPNITMPGTSITTLEFIKRDWWMPEHIEAMRWPDIVASEDFGGYATEVASVIEWVQGHDGEVVEAERGIYIDGNLVDQPGQVIIWDTDHKQFQVVSAAWFADLYVAVLPPTAKATRQEAEATARQQEEDPA